MNEAYECLDCFHIGEIDVHGHCRTCGSRSVVSLALVTRELPETMLERLLVREAR